MADNKDSLCCPACGEFMKKVFIQSMNKHIDICLNGCGGIFFDNREFEKVDEQHENIDEINALYENKTYTRARESEVRVCPYCGANMVKLNNHGVIIDVCYTCGGKFLDYNELNQYRGQYSSEEERSKVFANTLNEILNTDIDNLAENELEELSKMEPVKAPTYTDGKMDEIVYSRPPSKGLKSGLVELIRNIFG